MERDGDKSIFDGLEISKETALCEEYMGKYPVVSISLKGIDAWSYETAYQMAVRVIVEAAAKFYFLLDSEKLNDHDKAEYKDLLDKNMNEGTLGSSLRQLSGMLEKHYGTKVILLIDEYVIAGGVITKEIHQELTYPEIYQTIDNIWSLLFTTGYLTQRGKQREGR